LKAAGIPFEQRIVSVPSPFHKADVDINTIVVGQGPPLVMLHGFGAGVGFWVANLKELAKNHTVYAIDLPGFGRSSRPTYAGKTAEDAEEFFLSALEAWTGSVGLQSTKFHILGHSFGAYLAAVYSLRNPTQIEHLILADPWGVPSRPDRPANRPSGWPYKLIRAIVTVFNPNPLGIVRAAGPYGLNLITRFRGDIVAKFEDVYPADDPVVASYIYHMNTQHPSGEQAFKELTIPVGWAKKPLIDRLPSLPSDIPITLLYGDHSWMDPNAGKVLAEKLGPRAHFNLLDHCGHHIYVDNAPQFNYFVLGAGKQRASSNQSAHLSL